MISLELEDLRFERSSKIYQNTCKYLSLKIIIENLQETCKISHHYCMLIQLHLLKNLSINQIFWTKLHSILHTPKGFSISIILPVFLCYRYYGQILSSSSGQILDHFTKVIQFYFFHQMFQQPSETRYFPLQLIFTIPNLFKFCKYNAYIFSKVIHKDE